MHENTQLKSGGEFLGSPPVRNSPAPAAVDRSAKVLVRPAAADVVEVVVPKFNTPLKDSENERARELVNLHELFVTDVGAMNPAVAAYVRARPYMTPELMERWRMGYLPSNAKGLLRGHMVYGAFDEADDVLSWFGRDVNHDSKMQNGQLPVVIRIRSQRNIDSSRASIVGWSCSVRTDGDASRRTRIFANHCSELDWSSSKARMM